ncbi:hypothetical protein ACHAWF_009454 [Thalassiosira exigua]
MFRSRLILEKAGKSIAAAAEASKAAPTATSNVAAKVSSGTNSRSYPYILLHHQKQPDLFPKSLLPGTFGYFSHHVSSSASALVSLCISQKSRDRYLSLTESSPSDDATKEEAPIIDTSVLGQSDMGFLKPLTLFQDLDDPIYSEYPKFNVQEFIDGCGWALEEFHKTKDELLPGMIKGVKEKLGDLTEVEDVQPKEIRRDGGMPYLPLNHTPSSQLLGRLSELTSGYDFLDASIKDPDSRGLALLSMTTPEAICAVRHECFMRILVGGKVDNSVTNGRVALFLQSQYYDSEGNFRLIDDDTKVMNVALLSARVEEIEPPLQMEEQRLKQEDAPDEPLEDDSLTPNLSRSDSEAQIVTQMEVLYELQQSALDVDDKKHTQTSVMVARFEACLDGDPNGGELQWRADAYRPALEFGYSS